MCLCADCPFLMRFTAAWVYVAMATAGVSLHEKSKEYETACHLLRQLLGTMAYDHPLQSYHLLCQPL